MRIGKLWTKGVFDFPNEGRIFPIFFHSLVTENCGPFCSNTAVGLTSARLDLVGNNSRCVVCSVLLNWALSLMECQLKSGERNLGGWICRPLQSPNPYPLTLLPWKLPPHPPLLWGRKSDRANMRCVCVCIIVGSRLGLCCWGNVSCVTVMNPKTMLFFLLRWKGLCNFIKTI